LPNPYEAFEKTAANHVPLTPVSFINRAGVVYGDEEAIVYEGARRSWTETLERCQAVARALNGRGLGRGDTVSALIPNIPEMFELHFAVPMSGAVLNAINTRLEADTIAYILDHSDCKLLIADTAFRDVIAEAFKILGREVPVVDVRDANGPDPSPMGDEHYEDLVAEGKGGAPLPLPKDEWQAMALNYTSGTSGRPKGVVYHHRGAYLMAMGTVAAWSLPQKPTYLSVVPMFHCNGWNHPWAMAIVGGKTIFTRDPVPAKLYAAIRDEGAGYIGAAPIILQMMANAPEAPTTPLDPRVNVFTAGAPPPPAILEKMGKLGFNVMQVYGLTETYGHVTQCLWRPEWDGLPADQQAQQQACQGIAFPMMEETIVIDREKGEPVPQDGETQGEIAIRGNAVMSGYFKNPEATAEAFEGGYFWSGDAAVVHPNNYIEIRDRLKDVIISGGENISSVEVEAILYNHPNVQAAAVVAMPSEQWGESPCAFVELRDGADGDPDDMIAFCKDRLAGFKVPKAVVFGELPKTSTGKIQKFKLRDKAKDLGDA